MTARSGFRPVSSAVLGWLATAVLAACWLLPLLATWQSAPDLGHAWAVPLLMAYLWWERWAERPEIVARATLGPRWWLLAAVLALTLLPLRLLLAPFPVWPQLLVLFTALWSAAILTAAWLIAGKPGVRGIAGPLVLLIAALPVPTALEISLILPLREIMASLAADISNLCGHPAIASGTSIRLANSWVGVDEACGGIRSLQACVMIGLFFGEWYRFFWWRRGSLLVAAVFAALLGNFARVLFLALRATDGGGAVDAAHDPAGWIAMAASLTLTGLLAWRWAGYRWPAQQAPKPRANHNHSAGFHWLAAIALLFVANELGTRWWFARAEVLGESPPQWSVHLPEDNPTFRGEPLPDYAHDVLKPDLYVAGSWKGAPYGSASAYYIEWWRGQVARSAPFEHNPTVCLPLSGCELIETLPAIMVPWSGGELPFRAFKFRRAGQDSLVAFVVWDPAEGRLLADQVSSSYSRLQWWALQWSQVSEARQHQPAQLLTVSMSWHSDAAQRMKALLSELIASHDKQ